MMPGMQPATAVATSNSASSTSTTSPASAKRSPTSTTPGPSVPGTSMNTPRPRAAATLGMTRATRVPVGSAACSLASVTPAATETTGRSPRAAPMSWSTPSTCRGRTATITRSASATSSAAVAAAPPVAAASSRALAASTSKKMRDGGPGRAGELELIEEALLNEARPLLGRDLDVARREQEDLVADPLHAPVEGVGEPAAEVDESLGELRARALQVDDHRDVDLELVGDLLCVVEVLGDDQVDLDPRGARRLDGAHGLRR